jgi:hypothetical protein
MLAVLLLGTSCGREGFKFKVEFTPSEVEGKYYLTPADDNQRYFISKKPNCRGKVVFRGHMTSPLLVSITDEFSSPLVSFFLEEGRVEILPTEMGGYSVSGTPSNDACMEHAKRLMAVTWKYDTMRVVMDDSMQAAYGTELKDNDRLLMELNRDNIAGLYAFVFQQMPSMTVEEIERQITLFSAEMQSHPYMDRARERILELGKN